MTTTYVECPQCGKRALSVATRCPHCGFHFPSRPIDRSAEAPPLGRSRTTLALGAAAVVALVLAAVLVRRSPPRTAAAPSTPPGRDSSADTRPAPASSPAAVSDSVVSSPTASPAPAPPPAATTLRRYAQTWVNVRGDRARSAPTVGRLNPGDVVTVDSLIRGWYRVLVDGRALGYVHRSTLAATRPD